MINHTVHVPIETLQAIVERSMRIDSVTEGDRQENFIARFTGWLRYEDTEKAYDELSAALKPHDITPLFRWEETSGERRHTVVLVPGMPKRKPSNPVVNIVLLVLTLFSVLVTGALYAYEGPAGESDLVRIRSITH